MGAASDARRALTSIDRALIRLIGTVPNLDDPAVLAEVLLRVDSPAGKQAVRPMGVYQSVGIVRDELVAALYRLGPSGSSFTLAGATFDRVRSGTSTAWEGVRIAHLVAARCADRIVYDPVTGERSDEVPPPAVIAAHVADELVACAGLDAASKSWRTGDLKARGIDPDAYRTVTGGRPGLKVT